MSTSDRAIIDRLAKAAQARVFFEIPRGESPYADPYNREAFTYGEPWTGTSTSSRDAMWAAAHELGHVAVSTVSPLFALAGGSLYEEEAKAWLWALDHIDQLDDIGRASIQYSMGSYFLYEPAQMLGPATRELLERVGPYDGAMKLDLLAALWPGFDVQGGISAWHAQARANDLANAA